MSRRSGETTEDDRQSRALHGLLAKGQRSAGSLTLIFESGKPVAASPLDLRDIDVVTLARASHGRAARIAATDGERRLALEVEDRRMSLVHANLRLGAEGWSLEDAGSKNGTRVNGHEVSQSTLQSGDLIEVGRSFLVFRDDDPAPVHAAAAAVGMTTANPVLARQFERLAAIARSSIAILVRGETGTGKELVAAAVHQLSGRSGPLRAVNCGGLPRSLLESELFGFRKGAFSGANEDRPGLVRSADKGTLFLDEVADFPLDGQATLLRVLQEGEVVPVGGVKPIPVDVRVVAATHRDLATLVARAGFRQDLLARLTGFTVNLPPLRERREDLGALVRTLVMRHSPDRAASIELAPAAIRCLYTYSWPSNIRELEKAIAAALVLCGGNGIELEHLPESLRSGSRGMGARREVDGPQEQRDRLDALLARHHGNVSAVAAEMRTSRMQIHRLCRRLGIDVSAYRSKP